MSNIIIFPQKSKYDYPIDKALESLTRTMKKAECSPKLIEEVINEIRPKTEKIITDILSAGTKKVELKGVSGFIDEHLQKVYDMFHPQIAVAVNTITSLLAKKAVENIINNTK